MNNPTCEQFQMAAMALRDGEDPPIPPAEIESHLLQCAECREQVAAMDAFNSSLQAYSRRLHEADFASRIVCELRGQAEVDERRESWMPFAAIGAIALACKLTVLMTTMPQGLLIKGGFVLCMAALFAALKWNPFKVDSQIVLEKEIAV